MIEIFEISDEQRDYWDREVVQFESAHPLNAYGWGKVRAIDGWSPSYFMAKRNGTISGFVMVLTKIIPSTGLSIMYAQRGPVWNLSDHETLKALLNKIRMEAKKKRVIFLRADPNTLEGVFNDRDPLIEEGFIHLNHRWTFWNSPRDLYRIDLSSVKNEDELSKMIDRDARRCVRKAKNSGVVIRPADSISELEDFYNIFKEFSVDKGFMARGYEYQKSLWKEFVERGNGRLFLAIFEGEIIGGLICLIFARKCLAMHMGTPYKYQKLQTYYAYVWESIRWAWENGCNWYSFRGVGTTPSQEYFKSKFGPSVVSTVGYYDLPFYPLLYRFFDLSEFELLPRVWTALMTLRKGRNLLNRPSKTSQSETDKRD